MLVEDEEFEETLRDKEPFERVRLAWDRRLSPNPHALTIYLKFVLVRGAMPKRFEECECEDEDVRLHYET